LTQLKTILLTGATGFVGSYLLQELQQNGYEVIIVKRTTSDLKRIECILNQAIVYNLDEVSLASIFDKHVINAVIHAATSYGRKGESKSEIFQANFDFPLELLETGILNGLSCFINTDTFFTTDIQLPPGLSDYVLSKKQFVQYAQQIVANTNTHFFNLCLHHVFGPQDGQEKFISFLIRALQEQEELELTEGEQQRDYIYISDVARAYTNVLNQYQLFEEQFVSLDLGTGKAVTLRALVELVHKLLNSSTKLLFGALPYRKNEIMYSVADISSLSKIGWKPLVSLEDGIRKTIGIL